jgi:hypothetical protein
VFDKESRKKMKKSTQKQLVRRSIIAVLVMEKLYLTERSGEPPNTKGKQDSYEIPTTGRYMVFSIANGELRCINDAL